ncbi:LysR substrate-binding domain-containing protein [Erwinia pyri]|uniref:LysR substrate-binding domain-containing protein n=1 Tax=Erwinia pyri TaxID=3062598 RepID=A0AA50DFF7_9GAMM|nr:LysR family transcriptional regulator [Erwinia sp. DE2]WLS77291.1 LysR substrate-binding domain-containing protein [Erwinia sp. DE2]
MTIDRLTGLIAFTRAASLGSFSAASKVLGISPSAVSKSISRLEKQLGLSLFTRTTRSLHLTQEGRILYEKALLLLQEAENIQQAVISTKSRPSGLLRVTAPWPIAVHILAPALPEFHALYPDIIVDLRISDRVVDMTAEGIDVALRVGSIPDSRLIARRLGQHRICAFASPSYLKKRGTPLHPDELKHHDCVNFRFQNSGQLFRWAFNMDNEIEEYPVNGWMMADASEIVAGVIAAGGGIGFLATYMSAQQVRNGTLVPVMPEYAFDRAWITALWPESRRNSLNVRAFTEMLGRIFAQPTPWESSLAAFMGKTPSC